MSLFPCRGCIAFDGIRWMMNQRVVSLGIHVCSRRWESRSQEDGFACAVQIPPRTGIREFWRLRSSRVSLPNSRGVDIRIMDFKTAIKKINSGRDDDVADGRHGRFPRDSLGLRAILHDCSELRHEGKNPMENPSLLKQYMDASPASTELFQLWDDTRGVGRVALFLTIDLRVSHSPPRLRGVR